MVENQMAMRPRVTVHKGATIATGDYSNVRMDYTVEVEVPSGMTAGDVIADLEDMFDGRIAKQREAQQRKDSSKPEADWEKLPWKKYTHGPGEWVAAETKAVEGLLAKLLASNGVWQGANHLYRLSKSKTSGRLFIKRFPRSEGGQAPRRKAGFPWGG
jgi:hypothetical protein